MIDIQIIPAFDDNYIYLLKSPCGITAVVDPGEAAPVIEALEEQNLTLDYILITHHHWDHVGGNKQLKNKYGAKIIAPEKEAYVIKDIDQTVKEGDIFKLGAEQIQVIETAGHTLGSVCYHLTNSHALFTGDTVFSMGCGRLFEGSAKDMFTSFQKIMSLPDDTMIYCAHEYTRGNAGFCLAQDRNNQDLKERIKKVKALRSQGKPTLPVSLATEKKTNIFMQAKSAEEFAALRIKKDNF